MINEQILIIFISISGTNQTTPFPIIFKISQQTNKDLVLDADLLCERIDFFQSFFIIRTEFDIEISSEILDFSKIQAQKKRSDSNRRNKI